MKCFSNQRGFTLLELLITMSIVLIISSVAVPSYRDYRKKAFDVRALSDLKNIASAEELYFIDNETYLACVNEKCLDLPSIEAISQGVKITVTLEDDSFIVKSKHDSSDKEFTFNGKTGLIE